MGGRLHARENFLSSTDYAREMSIHSAFTGICEFVAVSRYSIHFYLKFILLQPKSLCEIRYRYVYRKNIASNWEYEVYKKKKNVKG